MPFDDKHKILHFFYKFVSRGGLFICWSDLCGHTLNLQVAYLCKSHLHTLLTFTTVDSNGNLVCRLGFLLIGGHHKLYYHPTRHADLFVPRLVILADIENDKQLL